MTGPPGDERLAAELAVLGSPVRLALLRALRTPKILSEISLASSPGASRESSHPLARQTVRKHLDQLLGTGLVVARATRGDARSPKEYVVNPQRIFALLEGCRELIRLRPVADPGIPTVGAGSSPQRALLQGPCLVLVKGLEEGASFDLSTGEGRSSAWTIGRKRGLAVSLDFDPFVSTEHAEIRWEGSFRLRDLPQNRNGTFVNFSPMAKGSVVALRAGDIIGVGRSLLLFRS